MQSFPLRLGASVAALIVVSVTQAAFAQTADTPLGKVCQRRGIYLKPHHFESLQGKPFKFDVETCLDGTAWSKLFNFHLQFDTKLANLQKSVDAFINTVTDTCENRSSQVKVTSVNVFTRPAVGSQQPVFATIGADAWQCSFPYIHADLKIDLHLALNTQNLRAIAYPTHVMVRPKNTVKDRFFVGWFHDRILNETTQQVQQLIDQYKDTLAENSNKIDLFKPVVKKLTVKTRDDVVAADLVLDARLPEKVVEDHSVVWIDYLKLK
ncbi:MAG: hypothetical protein GC182_09505 [Rhodopseudomonas sp.]|nr:hypothetical protein [Rhodopseudomonas sp.]